MTTEIGNIHIGLLVDADNPLRWATLDRLRWPDIHEWDPFKGRLKNPNPDSTMTELAIPFPEAGNHAILSFEFADFVALEDKFGDDYVKTIFAAIDRSDARVIRDCLTIGLKGGDLATALSAVPVDVIGERIADAIYLRLKGFRVSEGVPA